MAIRLVLCVSGLIAATAGATSMRASQRTTSPPVPEGFERVEAIAEPMAVHGPYRLSSRHIEQLAARPEEPGDPGGDVDDDEPGGDYETDHPCGECTNGDEENPDPRPELDEEQTPPPGTHFTSRLPVSDPQIAAGQTYLVVTLRDRVAFFSKDGTELQNIEATKFFNLVTPEINKYIVVPAGSDPNIWMIDTYYDLRTVYDPYRKRFWIAGLAINNKTTQSTVPEVARLRRNYIAAAVSLTEDPRDGWYQYFWQATGDDYACAPDCLTVTGADYPSIGISQKHFLQEVGAGRKVSPYSHVVIIDADALATGTTCSNCSYHFWRLTMPDGCPEVGHVLLQPAVHHDPHSFDLFASTWVYPDPGKPKCLGGQTRADGDPDKYGVIVWQFATSVNPPVIVRSLVRVKPFAARYDPKPGHEAQKVNEPDAEQPAAWNVTTPNFVRFSNIGKMAQKTIYRRGSLYVTWQDCVHWEQAPTCYMAVRLVRIQNLKATIDRTFGLRNAFDDWPSDFVYYGVPAVEVNVDGDMVVAYQRSGEQVYPEARYSVYRSGGPDILPSRALQKGDFPFGANAKPGEQKAVGNLDVAGVSVDPFDDAGVWMAHGYGTQDTPWNGTYGLAIGKVLGATYPDLIVSDVEAPTSLTAGATVSFLVKVKNQGDGASAATQFDAGLLATAPMILTYPLCTAQIPPLPPGAVASAQCTGTVHPGIPTVSYKIRPKVDPANGVHEYNEQNNRFVVKTDTVVIP
jgi:hypothetical protein